MRKKQSYSYLSTVITYIYNEDEFATLALNTFYSIYPGEVIEDLYAVPAFLQIINPKRLENNTDDEIETLANLNKEVDTHIFFTSMPVKKITQHFSKNQYTVIQDFDNKRIELQALNIKNKVQKLEKKTKEYDKLIARRMIIELKGLNGEKLYIEKLSKEFNVSERTIYRDFQFLNGIGELIEYSKEKKCYELVFSNYSDLFRPDNIEK